MHPPHRDERQNDGDWQRDDRHQRRADVPEKNQTDQRDDDAFFDQLLAQRADGTLDQIRAVVGCDDVHALGQRSFDFFQLLFYGVNDVDRILAVAHYDDAANDFAASIQLDHAAPQICAEMDVPHIFQIIRRAVLHFENDVLDVLNFFDVAAAANVILGGCDLEDFAADVGVAHLDCADDVAKRDVVSDQRVWIEIDLVLLDETANRRDFRDAFHRRKRVTQIPILNGTQLSEIVFSGVIDECVFVNPAYACGVGTDRRVHALRQRAAH